MNHTPIPQPPSYLTNTLIVTETINVLWFLAGTIGYILDNREWVKISLAGLILGILGTGIYLIQRRTYKKGSRGAQKVLS